MGVSGRCFVQKATTDNQSSFGMTDEGSQLREELGGVGNVYNVLIPTKSEAEYEYSSIKLINRSEY